MRYWFVEYCRAEAEKLQKTQFEGPNFETCITGNRGEDSVYGALGPSPSQQGPGFSGLGGQEPGGDTSISLLFPVLRWNCCERGLCTAAGRGGEVISQYFPCYPPRRGAGRNRVGNFWDNCDITGLSCQ